MSGKATILFLAANPNESSKLPLGEEIREIHAKIRAAAFCDSFDLLSRWAVRPLDLLQAFNEVQPHVVHSSDHGSRKVEYLQQPPPLLSLVVRETGTGPIDRCRIW